MLKLTITKIQYWKSSDMQNGYTILLDNWPRHSYTNYSNVIYTHVIHVQQI